MCYKTYECLGWKIRAKYSANWKKIIVYFVWDIKHDGHHNARLADDVHVTGNPLQSVYSGVASLKHGWYYS